MDRSEQRAKAESLRALHAGPGLFILPNAWDAASARIFARSPSCRALGTTSAGIAAVLGYPDGEVIPRSEMMEMVARIARVVDVPVSADVEAGYGASVQAAAETAAAVIAAGAVGLNIEDGGYRGGAWAEPLLPVDVQVERIRAIKETGESEGVPLVINARTNVFMREEGDLEERLDKTIHRLNAYLAAGADCTFVPGVGRSETIARLVQALDGPLNIFAYPGVPPVDELERLGVRRLSVGPQAQRVAFRHFVQIGEDLLERREFGFVDQAMHRDEVARLLGF
jgi:2-methylisocitrate lyase-like PEP mutase family enzyme